MCDSLYVKANGSLPCWCNSGESTILGTLDLESLERPDFDLFNIEPLVQLRRTVIVKQEWPFPDPCSRCAGRSEDAHLDYRVHRRVLRLLHLEPSFLCNLECPVCIKKETRKQIATAPYHMTPRLWQALISNLARNGTSVATLLMEGRGDPLMNPEVAELIAITHRAYPELNSELTTNGNFRFDPALFQAGLRKLRVSADGATEESYSRYRRGGSFAKVRAFMNDASSWLARCSSGAKLEWKFIIFEWNDSPEELRTASRIAEELGCELSFHLARGYGESSRFTAESLEEWVSTNTPNANGKYNRSPVQPSASDSRSI